MSLRRRDSFTRAGTRPERSKELVPSSSEKVKTPRCRTARFSTKARRLSKSSSVSPGKPTMNDVRMATPGTRSRIRSTMPRRLPRPVGRFMRFNTGVARVLQRDVHVLHDLLLGRDRVEDRVGEGRGVGVHHADPADPVDAAQPAQQVGEAVAHPVVEAVAGRVLRHEDDLAHAARGEPPRLRHDVLDAPAAVPPAQGRDDAERAGVVAALADLHVGEPGRRRENARRRWS